MASEDLLIWLTDIDLDEYEPGFKALGVKKVKHLVDITENDLNKIGMLELEIRRFFKKIGVTFPTGDKSKTPEAGGAVEQKCFINVPLPSPSFGKSALEISEKNLKEKYSELWYCEPQNFKQRATNEFVLKMCAAAEHRFSTRRHLFTWARTERDLRWNSMLTFAPMTQVSAETAYFKNQNLNYKLNELQNSYKDVFAIAVDIKTHVPAEKKYERVKECVGRVRELKKWCDEGLTLVENQIKSTEGKQGFKEANDFWKHLHSSASQVALKVNQIFESLELASNMYVLKFGEEFTYSQKAAKRRYQKNKHKVENRAARKLSNKEPPKKKAKIISDFFTYRPIEKLSVIIRNKYPELAVYESDATMVSKTLNIKKLSDIILTQYPNLKSYSVTKK